MRTQIFLLLDVKKESECTPKEEEKIKASRRFCVLVKNRKHARADFCFRHKLKTRARARALRFLLCAPVFMHARKTVECSLIIFPSPNVHTRARARLYAHVFTCLRDLS